MMGAASGAGATNPYEESRRLRKVLRLMALLPTPATRTDIEAEANELERWDADQRDAWAWAAGCRVRNPRTKRLVSEECWRLFVAATRARLTAEEALARAGTHTP